MRSRRQDKDKLWLTGPTGIVHPKRKSSHYLLTPVRMERKVEFHSPQNISGASQQNIIAAFS